MNNKWEDFVLVPFDSFHFGPKRTTEAKSPQKSD